jgi:hypothetical protein
MIVNYKGFEIDVTREKCMAGYDLVYRNIFRISDGYQLVGDFSDDNDTIREHVGSMKHRIDEYLKNPEQYEKDEEEYSKLFIVD